MDSIKTKKMKSRYYILMMILFFLTDSGVANYTGITGYYTTMALIIVAGGVGLLSILIHFKGRAVTSFSFLMLICVFIAVTGIVLGSGLGPILKHLCILLCGYSVATHIEYKNFKTVYINTCVFFAICALIMYVVVVFIPGGANIFPTINFTVSGSLIDRKYITIYFCNMLLVAGEEFPRLYSLFWEPGVCQIYFNIALLFLILNEQENKKFLKSIILLIAVIATQSTTGYITCMSIWVYYLLFVQKKKNITTQFLQIAIVVFLFSIIINYTTLKQSELYNSVFYKLEEGSNNISASSRIYSLLGNLLLAIKNPIIGVGLNKSAELLNQMKLSDYVLHQTNTFTNYLATFGVVIGCVFINCWIKIGRLENVKGLRRFLLFLVLFICFSGENLIGSSLINVIVMYGFIEIFDKSRIERA